MPVWFAIDSENKALKKRIAVLRTQLETASAHTTHELAKLRTSNDLQMKVQSDKHRQEINAKECEMEKLNDRHTGALNNKENIIVKKQKIIETLTENLECIGRKLEEVKHTKGIPSADHRYKQQKDELENSKREIESLNIQLHKLKEKLALKGDVVKDLQQDIHGIRDEMGRGFAEMKTLILSLKEEKDGIDHSASSSTLTSEVSGRKQGPTSGKGSCIGATGSTEYQEEKIDYKNKKAADPKWNPSTKPRK